LVGLNVMLAALEFSVAFMFVSIMNTGTRPALKLNQPGELAPAVRSPSAGLLFVGVAQQSVAMPLAKLRLAPRGEGQPFEARFAFDAASSFFTPATA
jgi:hypothetical protein